MSRIRDIFRLAWVYKPKAERKTCPFCKGKGRVHLNGTPAQIDEQNPNISSCGNCQGMGFTTHLVAE